MKILSKKANPQKQKNFKLFLLLDVTSLSIRLNFFEKQNDIYIALEFLKTLGYVKKELNFRFLLF